jgi:aspartyl-tRNA(Asn)/glutamyl-tRNA(Gln) amidotransferase subunit C
LALTPEQVAHVAALARLELTPEEASLYGAQLSAILEAAALLEELDVSGVEPVGAALAPAPAMRPDEPVPSLPAEQGLANAPARVGTAFAVPKILE